MSALPLNTTKVSGSSTLKTQLESTLKANDAGFEFTIQGGATFRWNGTSFDTISTGGAALVTTTGASGVSKDRLLAVTTDFTVGTRHRESWAAGAGPKAVLITVIGGTAKSKFLFNESDTGVADAMLAVVAGAGITVPYKNITATAAVPGDLVEKRFFLFSEPVETIDFIAGTAATEVEILGV